MRTIKHVIGVMSGTSLDGIDLAYVQICNEIDFDFKILVAETIAYSQEWTERLKGGFHVSEEELSKLDTEYGFFLGNIIKSFIDKNKIKEIDLIASHGHTIFHKPEQKYTLQIGNGPEICSVTNIKTICDFRVQDLVLGGQGAPLVPIGDQLLFSSYDYCLNLGGFVNVSLVENEQRIAYDICPVNIVLNHYVNKLGLTYDDKGIIASSGRVDSAILMELNALSFYKKMYPKSLGYEFVLDSIFPILEKEEISIKNILCTFVEHVAIQIGKVLPDDSSKKLLITGGGVYNDFLIERIKKHTGVAIVIPDDDVVNYKEALIFALLGYLKDQGKNNCLASVTGASRDHSSGVVFVSK